MFTFVSKIISPEEVRARLPLAADLARLKNARDAELKDIIAGRNAAKC